MAFLFLITIGDRGLIESKEGEERWQNKSPWPLKSDDIVTALNPQDI